MIWPKLALPIYRAATGPWIQAYHAMAGPGQVTASLPAEAIAPEQGLPYANVRFTVYADNRTNEAAMLLLCDAIWLQVPSKETVAQISANGLAYRAIDGRWELSLHVSGGPVFVDLWVTA